MRGCSRMHGGGGVAASCCATAQCLPNARLLPQIPACSLGLSATSQHYFSLRTNQPPATSRNQPAVLFSQNKPAPAIQGFKSREKKKFRTPAGNKGSREFREFRNLLLLFFCFFYFFKFIFPQKILKY
jgi:hypothetical protein